MLSSPLRPDNCAPGSKTPSVGADSHTGQARTRTRSHSLAMCPTATAARSVSPVRQVPVQQLFKTVDLGCEVLLKIGSLGLRHRLLVRVCIDKHIFNIKIGNSKKETYSLQYVSVVLFEHVISQNADTISF